jgi:hypothetical protein
VKKTIKIKGTKRVKTPNAPLTVEVVGGKLVISIGVSTLAYAVQNGCHDWTGVITDEAAFAIDVATELEKESEDGTTVVHTMLDQAAMEAANQGSAYVADEHEDDES